MQLKNLSDLVLEKHHINFKDEFIKACKDKDFKNYVYSLEIELDKLYKYTFILQDAVEMRKNCRKCKSYFSCLNKVKGYLLTPIEGDNSITFEYVPCSKCVDYVESLENITYYEVPQKIRNASFKELYKDDKKREPVIKYFKKFVDEYKKGEKPKGIFLTGSFGSGKTYMIAALFNELAKINIKSCIVYYPEFLRNLKASFKDNYDEKIEYVKRSPILLIDDIGAENCSGWNRDEILSPILQYRMDELLPTFFTSNFDLKELEEHLSNTANGKEAVKARRIIERIKQQSVKISLVTKNRRE